MKTTAQLFETAVTLVAKDRTVANRRPMNDDQRRAMFARSTGGASPAPAHRRPFRAAPGSNVPRKELPQAMPKDYVKRKFKPLQPGDPSGGMSFQPMPPSSGGGQIWPGGTPPWVFDPRIGGPNPNHPHPDNPNFGGPSIQPVPTDPGRVGILPVPDDPSHMRPPDRLTGPAWDRWSRETRDAMLHSAQPGPDTFMGPNTGSGTFTREGFHAPDGSFIPSPAAQRYIDPRFDREARAAEGHRLQEEYRQRNDPWAERRQELLELQARNREMNQGLGHGAISPGVDNLLRSHDEIRYGRPAGAAARRPPLPNVLRDRHIERTQHLR